MSWITPAGIITKELENSIVHTEENKHQEMLEIQTLGGFKVSCKGKELSAKAKRSAKLWELFKFLLANRGKRIPVESIFDSLWPDQEYCDQEAALHTLTHRMRRLIFEEFTGGYEPFQVEVSRGCYCMKLNGNCLLDVDQFARLYYLATELSKKNPEEALNCYSKAMALYKGEFLPDYVSEKWVLPAKRYYRNLYLQALTGKVNLLMEQREYMAVRELCKEAFRVEQFMEVEALHLYFMEALYKTGNPQEALCHYDFLTTSLYQEFGARPSPAMRDLYRRIKSESGAADPDLSIIDEKLMENEPGGGAFICDQDFFRFLYQLEKRRGERESQNLLIGLFNIN